MIPAWNVQSEKAAWASPWGTTIESVGWCGKSGLVLVHKVSGRAKYVPMPCNSWLCPDCSKKRAEEIVKQFGDKTTWMDRVWFARVRGEWLTTDRKRLNKRRQLKGHEYVLVRRYPVFMTSGYPLFNKANGYRRGVWIFASGDLSGKLPPTTGRFVTRRFAIDLLAAEALLLPGVAKTSFSVGWKEKRDPPTGMSWPLGLHGRDASRDAIEALYRFDPHLVLSPEEARDYLADYLVVHRSDNR